MPTRRQIVIAGPGLMLAGAARAQEPPESLEAFLKKTGAPALAGAVIDRNGLVHIEAAGARRNGLPEQVTVDDRWHLGSNTKAMTAALYGRLVEAGLAQWDATLPTLFPDLKLHPVWSATTIDQLLAHRAGLADGALLNPSWLKASRIDPRPLEVQRASLTAQALARPPKGKAGRFAYANVNYIVAGAAIERLTGGTWEAAMKRWLFEPLGMASAGFGAPLGDNAWGHRSPPFIGAVVAPTPMDPNDPGAENPLALGPAGTAHASLTDYGKFLRLFLTEGGGLLKPETMARLTRPVGEGGGAYALGWGIAPPMPWTRGPSLVHEGSNTMWHMLTVAAPERGMAIVTACNAGPHAARLAAPLLAQRLQKVHAP